MNWTLTLEIVLTFEKQTSLSKSKNEQEKYISVHRFYVQTIFFHKAGIFLTKEKRPSEWVKSDFKWRKCVDANVIKSLVYRIKVKTG